MPGLATSGIKTKSRITSLKQKTIDHKRYLSLEQALIITDVYKRNENDPVTLKRAKSLSESLRKLNITIDPEELIVGNRTPDSRAGVVFPEAGISWLSKEIEDLPNRPQDPFHVKQKDIEIFRNEIEPYWKGKTLEDEIYDNHGEELRAIEKVVKINQKDHAQGHICPNVENWLKFAPAGLLTTARAGLKKASLEKKIFFEAVTESLDASIKFILRYSELAESMAASHPDEPGTENLREIALVCKNLAERPPQSFREALQSIWFLFVILHMESNASSFSPGRMDQYLYPYLSHDLEEGKLDLETALELMDALFIKFNQIVYMRNAHSAKFFAGFPIGFNVTVGGQTKDGKDATNKLSYLILKAQDHIGLPQPNLTARLHKNSPAEFIRECSRVIGLGSGMPQIVNDESIIPALKSSGLDQDDAMDYALIGCVELGSQGNYLGWSDAAMFNLVKALELSLNNGECMITGEQIGLRTGTLADFKSYEEIEEAFGRQIDHFTERMLKACKIVERAHQKHLPSAFLSSVIDDCLEAGKDVTAGGAKYNLSGIQAIQVANIADSLAVLWQLVFQDGSIGKDELLQAMRNNFKGYENIRYECINKIPKYGNDVEWVDELGAKWVNYFNDRFRQAENYRGGDYHLGLYTVTAHVPMGQNVGATPDGRKAGMPLADGGISPMYGRDKTGPTAILRSVSRIPSLIAGNGSLLNMKFLPSFFETEEDRDKFSTFLKAFVRLPIHHVQFNVVSREDLLNAKKDPEKYRGLTVRVAGYSAFFTELAEDMQDEIISRTSYGSIT
ncbi:MAG TPA: formate C-acetyltransferase/glycerol dehydratase family glycyl radical enzyme [Bacteroides sp.]|nr:formate C-acetyltransferase/glycerol dehydratase family glycyl radical enzyme [Bacteroides sp.]